MKMSAKGRQDVCHHEGIRKKPYLDSILLWTTGVGHLIAPIEQQKMTLDQRKEAKKAGKLPCPAEWNRTLTDAEVDQILQDDLARFERGVLRYCPSNLTQGRFDALVSFAFNAGLGALQKSSIRMKHNRGDFAGAADSFLLYRMAGGRVEPGLVRRRNDERAVYLGA
jgi:lysozyme